MKWEKISQAVFDAAAQAKPRYRAGRDFLAAPRCGQRICRSSRHFLYVYQAYVVTGDGYFRSEEPITVDEFDDALLEPIRESA